MRRWQKSNRPIRPELSRFDRGLVVCLMDQDAMCNPLQWLHVVVRAQRSIDICDGHLVCQCSFGVGSDQSARLLGLKTELLRKQQSFACTHALASHFPPGSCAPYVGDCLSMPRSRRDRLAFIYSFCDHLDGLVGSNEFSGADCPASQCCLAEFTSCSGWPHLSTSDVITRKCFVVDRTLSSGLGGTMLALPS